MTTTPLVINKEPCFLSVIIPFCDYPDLPHLRTRIEELCEDLSTQSGVEVIVLEGRSARTARTSQVSAWRWASIRHVDYVNDNDVFSIAAARNLGAQQAIGVAVAFCDVDLRVS